MPPQLLRSWGHKKGHNFVQKIVGLPPLLVWVPLLIVNNYYEFQVNIFSNNRDIRLHLENSKSKMGHNFVKKIGGLPPLLVLVWVPLLIVNNCSGFQVNIFSNNRDIRKCQSFCTTPTTTPGLCQYLHVFFEKAELKIRLSCRKFKKRNCFQI